MGALGFEETMRRPHEFHLVCRLIVATAVALAIGPLGSARAQDEEAVSDGAVEPEPEPEPEPELEPEAEPEPGPGQTATSPPAPAPIIVNIESDDDDDEEEEPERSPLDPYEADGDQLYHFGAFLRGIFIPQYGQNFFVAGGNDALRPAAGVFFNYRQDGFNFLTEVWWANFFNVAPYRGINETEFETEWIESELNVLFVSLVAMFSIPLTSWLAIEIGGGLGFGGIFGDLWRTEAYPDPMAAAGWTPCNGPGDPSPEYCDDAPPGGEGSYQRQSGTSEPYNFEGGVPPLWFWVELPRVAIRFKPMRQFQLRAEAGFVVYGFHFGASAAIGF